jgi:hypothetical protein
MFWAMFSPIIRSTWLYLQYLVVFIQVAVGWCQIQSSAPDDGWKHCLKHEEPTWNNELIYIAHFVGYFHDYLHGLQLWNSLNTEMCLGKSITSEKGDWSSEPMIVIHHTWSGVPQVYTVFWWTVCKFLISLAGPYAQPIFHPVTLNVFPADPIVIVLSHIPGRVAVIKYNQLIHNL